MDYEDLDYDLHFTGTWRASISHKFQFLSENSRMVCMYVIPARFILVVV